MHTEYEYLADNDVAALQAEAAYYDEVAQQPARPTPSTKSELPETHHLKLARRYTDEYEKRINTSKHATWDSQRDWEDRAYKLAMMNAALAQAEAATRQAEVAESMLEFAAELVGGTDLVNTLLQIGYRQRAG